ncbi:DUF4244 domain-containing protein [Microbispora sp. H10885]|uniref:DUF4244 domain-containing protein n=1 Tax=Microbispora sp. H10885 TaxID=2729110 RepID=UPI002176175D|nr:DUF4244 domain-containing protein [Microbispora sp. H10885]
MSRHAAATGRTSRADSEPRRRSAEGAGRHRARSGRWTALGDAVWRVLDLACGRGAWLVGPAVVAAMASRPKRGWPGMRRAVGRATSRARKLGIQWVVQARTRADAGMSTAEYAVGTIAACGFAALLYKIVTSAEVRSMLAALIQKALKLAA